MKVSYLTNTLRKLLVPNAYRCPNCGESRSVVIERKYVVTSLRRCAGCNLMFRAPADSPAENKQYYSEAYSQGFTTEMPDDETLKSLMQSMFRNTERDYGAYLSILEMLGCHADQSMIDFGCSWGYGSYQLQQADYDVHSYEISAPRARYAEEKLGVRLIPDFDAWSQSSGAACSFDVFFSAHVLEHVPSPGKVIRAAFRVLKPGGLFVAFHPNGSAACRAAEAHWSQWWGEVHPNMIDDVFYDDALAEYPRLYGSSPGEITSTQRDLLMNADRALVIRSDNLSRGEMFVAARKLPVVPG